MRRIKFLSLCLSALVLMLVSLSGCHASKPATAEQILKHNIAVQQIKDRQFMVKGTRLVLNKHTFHSLTPSTNFVLVDGDNATVQISPGMGGGTNGVGGFTVKGSVSGYEVNVKQNGAVSVKYHVQAAVGSCTVVINLPKDGVNATVNINNTFKGKNATLYGDLTPIDNSIFVGRPIY